jgi:predicted DNA-binding protein (MmcQ/YjbR family)
VSRPRALRRRVLAYALGFPGAHEEHPWDEDVAKVGSKIFVFLGMEDSLEPGMTVKLRESHEQALSVPGAAPAGYGLGRSGWVSVPFGERTHRSPSSRTGSRRATGWWPRSGSSPSSASMVPARGTAGEDRLDGRAEEI